MNQHELHELLQRYQRGGCTPEEEQLVRTWYELLGRHQPVPDLTPADLEALRTGLWQRIAARTHPVRSAEVVAPVLVPASAATPWYAEAWRWAAAAALALGLGVGAYQLRPHPPEPGTARVVLGATDWQRYVNTADRPHTVRLGDGSTVRVAPGGWLRYPGRFAAGHRTVYLGGEAFFTVTPDQTRPFRVYTREIVTTVLGTSFLVRAPADRAPVLVKVRTGRVQVRALATSSPGTALAALIVRPNQQAVYLPTRHELARELVAEPVQVAARSFEFDDRPVTEVLTALEQAYGVRIVYDAPALAGCTVTLNLPETSLYAKLDVLCKTLGASYAQADAQILFRSPGCRAR